MIDPSTYGQIFFLASTVKYCVSVLSFIFISFVFWLHILGAYRKVSRDFLDYPLPPFPITGPLLKVLGMKKQSAVIPKSSVYQLPFILTAALHVAL